MNGHPTWKTQFQKAFPRISILKKRRKHESRVDSAEILEDLKKSKLTMETDTYFKQLNDSWI